MIRKAFKMFVRPEAHAEYERRHRPIWPELEQVLREHGVRNYSIYLDAERSELVAFAEIEDESRWQAIASTEVCRRWWQHMSGLMVVETDLSPRVVPLREVFHIGRPTEGG